MEIERVQRPFWAHQLVEYLLGIALISVAVQQPQPAVPAILGLLIVLNAAVAKGAAGAFRLVGPRLHRIADLVLMALLVVGAIQPWASLDNVGRLALGGVAFVLFFVWFHTDFTERTPRAKRTSAAAARAASGSPASPPPSTQVQPPAGSSSPPSPSSASPSPTAPSPTSSSASESSAPASSDSSSEELGRRVGRIVGGGVNSMKRWKDSVGDAMREGRDEGKPDDG